jgi:hypothetical protein
MQDNNVYLQGQTDAWIRKTKLQSMKSSLSKWLAGGIVGAAAVFFGVKTMTKDKNVADDRSAQQVALSEQQNPSRPLYGLNGLVKFNKVSLSDPRFIKAIDSLKIDWFRYPGGTNANYDNWRTDSPSLRSVQLLVQGTGMKIMFDMNILTASLDDQLQMLDEANRLGIVGDGIFELGNELNQFNYKGKERFPNARAYADTCHRWIAELKKRFPKAQFAVVGENKKWKGAEDWANIQVKTNPEAYLIWHFYPPGKFTHNGKLDTSALKTLIREDYVKSFGKNIPASKVWITEFNIGDHDKDPKELLDTLSPGQEKLALKFALQEFASMGIKMIGKHNVVGKKYAAVYADKKTAYLLPVGRAIREFMLSQKVIKQLYDLTSITNRFR